MSCSSGLSSRRHVRRLCGGACRDASARHAVREPRRRGRALAPAGGPSRRRRVISRRQPKPRAEPRVRPPLPARSRRTAAEHGDLDSDMAIGFGYGSGRSRRSAAPSCRVPPWPHVSPGPVGRQQARPRGRHSLGPPSTRRSGQWRAAAVGASLRTRSCSIHRWTPSSRRSRRLPAHDSSRPPPAASRQSGTENRRGTARPHRDAETADGRRAPARREARRERSRRQSLLGPHLNSCRVRRARSRRRRRRGPRRGSCRGATLSSESISVVCYRLSLFIVLRDDVPACVAALATMQVTPAGDHARRRAAWATPPPGGFELC